MNNTMYIILRKDSGEYVKEVRIYETFGAVVWNRDKGLVMQNTRRFMKELADNIKGNYPQYNLQVVKA